MYRYHFEDESDAANGAAKTTFTAISDRNIASKFKDASRWRFGMGMFGRGFWKLCFPEIISLRVTAAGREIHYHTEARGAEGFLY